MNTFSFCLFSATLITLMAASESTQAEVPNVRVENVRRVFNNVEQNAFNDVIRWKGRFWLAFRSCPGGHGVDRSASIIVLRSDDAQTWEAAVLILGPGPRYPRPAFSRLPGETLR